MKQKTSPVITKHTPEIEAYLKSIRKYQPLTQEQEEEVFTQYHSNDPDAKQKAVETLVNSNQRFIFSLAKEYAKGDETKVLDYVNEGSIGIINAIDKFDQTRGFKFISFAVWYIRQAMTNYAQTTDLFLRKSNNAKIGNNILKIRTAFFQENHREPTVDEIKEALAKKGIKIKDDRDLEDVVRNSIDSVWGDESTFENNPRYIQHSAIRNEFEDEMDDEENKSVVGKLLKNLDERSQLVIRQLFGIGYENPIDIEVVAENLGLTPTRVGQIKNAALKKLQAVAAK